MFQVESFRMKIVITKFYDSRDINSDMAKSIQAHFAAYKRLLILILLISCLCELKMNRNIFSVLIAVIGIITIGQSEGKYENVRNRNKCPVAVKTPENCFSADDVKNYATTATSLESLYNRYVNILTNAQLTIDGDEVRIKVPCHSWDTQ